nr:virulence RhuM family protein [Leptospira selangorensis]
MASLYDRSKQTISEHLQNLFEEGELDLNSVVRNFRTTAPDGKKYEVQYYNLDAILAVGFRVRSLRGTQFRKWAISRLREYLVKGFIMDDERLKHPSVSGLPTLPDYFDELLERIRDIRASERRMYLRVLEIFALAADYELNQHETQLFFSTVQNKLLFAVTGMTAAELISKRADASKANMGLTVWKGEVVRKSDVTTSKNYLLESEISEMNRIVVMWLDYAEDQANRRKQIFQKDWKDKLDDFLRFNERNVLPNAGTISKDEADEKAFREYETFSKLRRETLEYKGAEDSIKQLESITKLSQEKP